MRKSRRILIGVVVALAAVFAPAAGAQLPTVSVPSVSTPTVTTPSVQVPSVTVPQTPVQTPQVQAPSVQLPNVQTPQLHVQVPQTQTPHVPGVNVPSVPGAPSVGGVPGVNGPSGAAGRAGSGFGLAADGSPIAADGTFAPASPRQARAIRRRAERRHRAARAREARLRDSARRLRGCLDALPSFDRRVIILRAGIDGAPRTRRQVAKRLDVSVDRVRDAERSGVRGLRRADSDLGCGSLPGATGGPTATGVGLAVSSVGRSEPGFDTRLASNAPADRNAVAGETRSSDDSGGFDPGTIVQQIAGAESGDSNLPLVALLALLVIALMAVELLRGRSRRMVAAAGVVDEAPWAAALREPPADRKTDQRGTTDPVSSEPAAPPHEGNGTTGREGSATAAGIRGPAKRIRARLKP
jgi:hypothetical protein